MVNFDEMRCVLRDICFRGSVNQPFPHPLNERALPFVHGFVNILQPTVHHCIVGLTRSQFQLFTEPVVKIQFHVICGIGNLHQVQVLDVAKGNIVAFG